MRSPILMTVLLTLALHGCSYLPTKEASIQPLPLPAAGTEQTASPAAEKTPEAQPGSANPCANDFDAFNVNKDTFLSFDEYVEGKYGRVRFIKAPTEQEVAAMKESLRQEAQAADKNGDGKLSREEFLATCQ